MSSSNEEAKQLQLQILLDRVCPPCSVSDDSEGHFVLGNRKLDDKDETERKPDTVRHDRYSSWDPERFRNRGRWYEFRLDMKYGVWPIFKYFGFRQIHIMAYAIFFVVLAYFLGSN
jgi:hypothetical protein